MHLFELALYYHTVVETLEFSAKGGLLLTFFRNTFLCLMYLLNMWLNVICYAVFGGKVGLWAQILMYQCKL